MASTTRTVEVNDRMQRSYTYACTEPVGKNFDPLFRPDLTPKEMLEFGVFGGVYLRDCTDEFPKNWFTNAKLQTPGTYKQNPKLNYFGVRASQSLAIWREKGWLYKDDPRGWFQWYCRYYQGRRLPKEDARQIRRWNNMRRHASQIQNSCERGDRSCHTRQRQALMHWAYDSRGI